MRPIRWLFAARVDTFVRELARVRDAVAAAEEVGHSVELYLSGFEAFSDDVLARFNKGVTVDEQLANTTLTGRGRHDPCVLPRAVPLVEAMTALVLVDHALRHKAQCG